MDTYDRQDIERKVAKLDEFQDQTITQIINLYKSLKACMTLIDGQEKTILKQQNLIERQTETNLRLLNALQWYEERYGQIPPSARTMAQ